MNIGSLNKRLILQKPSDTLDDYGQKSTSWSDVKTIWGNIKPVSGREKMRSGAVESTLSHTIAVRFDTDLCPLMELDGHRIKYSPPEGERLFNIKTAIDMDEKRQYIIMDCEEGSVTGG